jgi:hypothetical protein
MLAYAILDLSVAYLAWKHSVDWYLPVTLSTLFFAVLELTYQLIALNSAIAGLEKRLPVDISNLAPAISSYIRELDDKRSELVVSASSGTIEIEGAASPLLAKQLSTAQGFFYAVSPVAIDMALWSSPARRIDYIQAQRTAIGRNVEIRRIFMGLALHEIYEEAISQRQAGIQVRFLTSINRAIVDMAIFDNSLVYYIDNNKAGRLSTQQGTVKEKLSLFNQLWAQADSIPASPPDDKAFGINVYTESDSSFGKCSLLHAWDESVDTGEFMTPSIADSGYREFLLGMCRRLGQGRSCFEVLSLGAGTGSFEKQLEKEGALVSCLELLPQGVDILRRKGLDVIEGNCTDLSPLSSRDFDLILIDGVTVHLGDISFRQTLKESIEHLKPGGTIIVSSDAPQDPNVRSEPHRRVVNGVLRSQRTIVTIAAELGLSLRPNTPTEFPYYRPIRGYTKRAIAVLELVGEA